MVQTADGAMSVQVGLVPHFGEPRGPVREVKWAMPVAFESTYAQVRALERGLELLMRLNERGQATPKELAEATGIDRATVYRLLKTLGNLGFVAPGSSAGRYGLLPKVRRLSDGFTARDAVCRIVAPELWNLLAKVAWPSDFAVFDGGAMVIRDTTHPFSPFSIHRAMIGRERPLTRSALGLALLEAASPKLRRELLSIAATQRGDRINAEVLRHQLNEVKLRGYGWSAGAVEDRIGAIALPVRFEGQPLGAVNIIFFRSSMSSAEAAARFLPALKATVASIEHRLADELPDGLGSHILSAY